MHRFYLPPDQCHRPLLHLQGREAHHAAHVLRVRTGEKVSVLDGAGHEFICEVQSTGRDEVQLVVKEKKTAPALPCPITLLQAVPKGKIIESIIQRATELGVARIVPLLTERVVTQLDDEDAVDKAEKWRQVAIEAIKQCGSPWLPQVEKPVTPKQFLARGEKIELPLIASLQEKKKLPRDHFREFQERHGRRPTSVCIWIGPEGDFTEAEVGTIISAGALPITLGNLVLRVETASVYCLSVVNHELSSVF